METMESRVGGNQKKIQKLKKKSKKKTQTEEQETGSAETAAIREGNAMPM